MGAVIAAWRRGVIAAWRRGVIAAWRRGVIAAPGILSLLLVATPAPVDAQQSSGAQQQLSNALTQDMNSVGGASGAYVLDLSTSKALFSWRANAPRLPASVEKLYTTSTALLRLGPTSMLTTSVFGQGALNPQGVWSGTVYLRGGGDPTFGSAGFDRYAYGVGATAQRLARNLRAAGIRAIHGQIVGDASYFDPLPGTSESGFRFDPYMEGSLSALAYNRGLVNGGSAYVLHPARFAASRLVSALRGAGIKVPGGTKVRGGRTPSTATLLASVKSPRLATLIRLTNTPSDNFFAEMLLKGLGARLRGAGTTAAGAAVVRAELANRFGVYPTLVDGSGLSRADHTSPLQVVTLLTQMASSQPFVNSLAIAGETGTLSGEGNGTAAQGRCHGKTGTLSDVGNLAGYCTGRDGHTLAFAFLMNGVGNPDYAHSVEARMMVALAKYNG